MKHKVKTTITPTDVSEVKQEERTRHQYKNKENAYFPATYESLRYVSCFWKLYWNFGMHI